MGRRVQGFVHAIDNATGGLLGSAPVVGGVVSAFREGGALDRAMDRGDRLHRTIEKVDDVVDPGAAKRRRQIASAHQAANPYGRRPFMGQGSVRRLPSTGGGSSATLEMTRGVPIPPPIRGGGNDDMDIPPPPPPRRARPVPGDPDGAGGRVVGERTARMMQPNGRPGFDLTADQLMEGRNRLRPANQRGRAAAPARADLRQQLADRMDERRNRMEEVDGSDDDEPWE